MRATLAILTLVVFTAGCTSSTSTSPEKATTSNDQAETVTEEVVVAEPSVTDVDPATSAPPETTAAAESSGIINIGDNAPSFSGLVGVDDQQHSLSDYAQAKAVAIIFTCNSCPVAVAYEDRLNAIHKDYADKGVELVAINVNNIEADKLPAMKQRAQEKGFEFDYLYDPTQKVGRDYGAKVTPHVFLLNSRQQLAYVGPIDDNQNESAVTRRYLRDAIDSVLAGNAPTVTNEEPFGCGIKYE
jgi:peroxiredoxin